MYINCKKKVCKEAIVISEQSHIMEEFSKNATTFINLHVVGVYLNHIMQKDKIVVKDVFFKQNLLFFLNNTYY